MSPPGHPAPNRGHADLPASVPQVVTGASKDLDWYAEVPKHGAPQVESSSTFFGDLQYFGHMFIAAVIGNLKNHYQELILCIIIICIVKYYLKKVAMQIKILEYMQRRDRAVRARNARMFRINSFIDFSEV